MQEHIKGPYSEILQKNIKNNTTQEEKPRKTKTGLSVQNRTTQHL